jgi:hypothetical protein
MYIEDMDKAESLHNRTSLFGTYPWQNIKETD